MWAVFYIKKKGIDNLVYSLSKKIEKLSSLSFILN